MRAVAPVPPSITPGAPTSRSSVTVGAAMTSEVPASWTSRARSVTTVPVLLRNAGFPIRVASRTRGMGRLASSGVVSTVRPSR